MSTTTTQFTYSPAEVEAEWAYNADTTRRIGDAVSIRPHRAASTFRAPTAPAPTPVAPIRQLPANIYPGECTLCHTTVAAGAGTRDKINGRWVVTHTACPETPAVSVAVSGAASAVDVKRPNMFGAKCRGCSKWVDEYAGVRELVDGRWKVWHREGECPTTEVHGVPEGRYATENTDGTVRFWVIADGSIYAQASSDTHRLQKADRVEAVAAQILADGLEATARRYGREIGECCRCGRVLTSEWRQEGIGPVCSTKAGW